MNIKKLLIGGAVVLATGYAGTKVFSGKAARPEPPGLKLSQSVLRGLHGSIRPMAVELLYAAAAKGIPLVITSGFRSSDAQARLYAQGRTTPGRIVTHAKPGVSWHNYGLAFDVAVLKDGKATWPNDRALWNRIGAIGKLVGLTWGGDFPEDQIDLPHFDHHPDMRIADAMAGKRPSIA